jgi:hypothetical protein
VSWEILKRSKKKENVKAKLRVMQSRMRGTDIHKIGLL